MERGKKLFALAALLLTLLAILVLFSGCAQQAQPAQQTAGDETLETPVSELEAELQYLGDTYLATFDVVVETQDLVDTGNIVNGHKIYKGVRSLEDENRIYIQNAEGDFEEWVKEGARLGELHECPALAKWNGSACAISEEDSGIAAEMYAQETSTYEFDGLDFTFQYKGVKKLICEFCWEFTFEWDSRYAGYGDRSAEQLEEQTTHHVIKIQTNQGEVVSAVIDGVWDDLKGEMVQG